MISFACSEFTSLEEQMDLLDSEQSTLESEEGDLDDPFARKAKQLTSTSTSQNFALKFPGQWKSEYVLTANGTWTVDKEKAEEDVRNDFTVVSNSTRTLLPGQIKENQVKGKVDEYTDDDFCSCQNTPETCIYWTLDVKDPNNTTVRLNVELAGISALVNNRHSKFSLDLSTLSEEGEKIPRVLDFSYSINGGPLIALDNQDLIWSGNISDCKVLEDWVYDNTTIPTNPGTSAHDLINGQKGKKISEILLGDDFHGNNDVCNHAEIYKGQFVLDLLNLNEGKNTITIKATVKGNEQTVDAEVTFEKDIKITGSTPNCN
jgi:hypothetical protein